MKTLKLIALSLLVACTSKQPAPTIDSFTATPDQIHPGEKSTLAWSVTGATQITLDHNLGPQDGHSLQVSPTATTTYNLTATGLGGTDTKSVTVTVLSAVPKAVINSFVATPNTVAVGGNVTLSWGVTGQIDSIILTPGGIDLGPSTNGAGSGSYIVSVSADTTYTLTVHNPGGDVFATAPVTTHPPVLHLQYDDPPPSSAKLRLVRSVNSTDTRLVLDLKVATAPVTAFGAALTIPFDIASAGMVAFTAPDSSSLGGLSAGVINFGSSPATAAAALTSATAPVPYTFTVGVAKHKTSPADGDQTWNSGDILFSVAFDMCPGATNCTGSAIAGTNVFLASSLANNAKYRAAALHKDGTEAVSRADIAIGNFTISF